MKLPKSFRKGDLEDKTKQLIEGPILKGSRNIIVDDIVRKACYLLSNRGMLFDAEDYEDACYRNFICSIDGKGVYMEMNCTMDLDEQVVQVDVLAAEAQGFVNAEARVQQQE